MFQKYTFLSYSKNIMDEKLSALKKSLEKKYKIAETVSFFAHERSWQDILLERETVSFFEGGKILIIYHFHLYSKKDLEKYLEEDHQNIFTIFISYEDTKKINPGLLEKFKKLTKYNHPSFFYKNQLEKKLKSFLDSQKWKYTKETIDYLLLQLRDSGKEAVLKMIEELKIYYPPGSHLDKNSLYFIFRSDKEVSAFQFLDAFFLKEVDFFLSQIALFPEDFSFLSLNHLFFRQVYFIYEYLWREKAGFSSEEIYKFFNLAPFLFEKIKKQADLWTIESILELHQDLYDCQISFKKYSGQVEKRFHKDLFLMYICKSYT